jgi:hypothetical protein
MVQTRIAIQVCEMHDITVYSQISKCEIFLQAVTLISGQHHKQNPEEVFVIMYVGRQFQLTAI